MPITETSEGTLETGWEECVDSAGCFWWTIKIQQITKDQSGPGIEDDPMDFYGQLNPISLTRDQLAKRAEAYQNLNALLDDVGTPTEVIEDLCEALSELHIESQTMRIASPASKTVSRKQCRSFMRAAATMVS